jgi:methyltransferase
MKRQRDNDKSIGGASNRKRADNGGSDRGSGRGGPLRQTPRDEASAIWASQLNPEVLKSDSGDRVPVKHTVSMAIPGSILRGAQTRELRSYLVGQIARAAVVHEVDEIIVFVDSAYEASAPDLDKTPSVICCRLLQYLECPSYLRKALFPVHPDLALAGLLPTLDTPHHMRREDISLYREGVVVENKASSTGCYVNVGLSSEAYLARPIKPGVRVTVELDDPECGTVTTTQINASVGRGTATTSSIPTGDAVAPTKPRSKHGLYWGYQTRLARNFSEIFSECPYKTGYDLLIGHSSSGENIDDANSALLHDKNDSRTSHNHVLVVFGGSVGIENCVDSDETLATPGRDASSLFDYWLNLCPTYGSKTVRTEELVFAGLASLRPTIKALVA